jgi:hypothetical protein
VALTQADPAGLRAEFERLDSVVIEGLLDDRVLDRVERELDAGEFAEISHPTGHTELCMLGGRTVALLLFLCNDPRLIDLVVETTGCGPIDSFVGRVYKMLPGPAHGGSWHDDNIGGRRVAMSVNLGRVPYQGGVTELRDRKSGRILRRLANTGAGDALLFRVGPDLEHRVTGVEGEVPKTAYAGWFGSPGGPTLAPAAALHPAR